MPHYGVVPGLGNFGGGGLHDANNSSATTKKTKDKNPPCANRSGDPIQVSEGARTEALKLFSARGEMALAYQLFYLSPIGWRDSLSYYLDVHCGRPQPPSWRPPHKPQGPPCLAIKYYRPDGSTISFSGAPGTMGNHPEIGGGGLATLVENGTTYTLRDENTDTLTFSTTGQLESIVDASGIGWTITYNAAGQPAKVTHTDGESYTLSYSSTSNTGTVTVTDPAGNTYTYTKHGLPLETAVKGAFELLSLTYPGSPATTLTYQYSSESSGIAELIETDINGVPYSYGSYSSTGLSTEYATGTRLADGGEAYSIVYTYPATGTEIATITNPLGHTSVNTYHWIDGQYLLTSISNEAVSDCGATLAAATYDSNGNLTKMVDNNGAATTYSYAATGQLQTKTEAHGSAVARTTTYAWDPDLQLNRPLSITVGGYLRTSYTYNAHNRLASVTRTNLTGVGAANQSLTTTYAYTRYTDGMVHTMTVTQPSPGGSDHTSYTYDGDGNLTSMRDGLGHLTTYSGYNALGEVGKVVGPNGDATNYTYDARGRVASKTTHPNGTAATWTYAYDGFGLPARVDAPDGEVTAWTRDAGQRVTRMIHNDMNGTSTATFTYDANNDVTSAVSKRGSVIGKSATFSYDGLGRVYQAKGANGQKLTYTYDGNGNVLAVTDALHHVTRYTYDALDRVASVNNAKGGITTFVHDKGDHVTEVTDPRGLVTTYGYDGLGHLWRQVSPDTGTTSFSHDAYGRLASKHRADGTTLNYAYDALKRLTSVSAGGETHAYTWDSCSNGIGRLCTATVNGTDSVDYSYTPEGWIVARGFSIVGGPVYTVGFGYTAMGKLDALAYPDDVEALYDYSRGVVKDVRIKIGSNTYSAVTSVGYRPMDSAMSRWTSYSGTTSTIGFDASGRPTGIQAPGVESLAFSYDEANRITAIIDGMDAGHSEALGYDALGRLTSMSSSARSEAYSYDADGNRLSKVINGTVTHYAYSASSNRLASAGGTSYGYNADGNTVSMDGFTAYSYGAFNRLTNASGAAFLYSASGQRLRKTFGGATTLYAPGAGGAVLGQTQSGYWSDYVWLNGRVVARVRQGGIYPIYTDQTGRPIALTHDNNTLLWAAQGAPFDREITVSGSVVNVDIGFPGQLHDSEDGLWHNGARDYDATLGRYIESDPVGLAGGVNTYAYVGSNPVGLVDPLGLYCLKEWQVDGIAGAAVGGALGAAAGSETGPGAIITGLAGAVINGGLGALGGLLETSQANGAALGAAGALAAGGSRSGLAGAGYGGALGGAVSSQLENSGYPPGVALPAGGAVGGSVGAAVGGYFKELSVSGMLTSGLKGSGIGLAAGAVQAGLEAALRAGNSCGCKQ